MPQQVIVLCLELERKLSFEMDCSFKEVILKRQMINKKYIIEKCKEEESSF